MTHPASEPNPPAIDTTASAASNAASNRNGNESSNPGACEPIVCTTGVSRTFPGVKALQGVDFHLFPGEVHTLMGQNGAGKSTLINVLTGVIAPDAGTIRLAGEVVAFASPQEAEAAGVRTLYQEVNLCPNLSVAENIFAGRQPRRFGAIDWTDIKRRAQAALARLDIALDVTRSLDAYPIAVQQMVAIARALSVDARVLILDEPTSSLDDSEVAQLFKILRHLKQSGIAILFVTHFIEQTYAISDRITVMRNGEREGEYLARDLSADQLVSKMVGHERMSARFREAAHEASCPEELSPDERAASAFIELRGVGRRGRLQPIDLDVRRGQILGLEGCWVRAARRPRACCSARIAPTAAPCSWMASPCGCARRTTRCATASRIARKTARKRALSRTCRFARTSCWPCRRGAVGGARSVVSAHENWPTCG
jgi:simple sugar transport system ATP-binding protein